MNKAKRKNTPKPPQHHPLEEQASPELRSLIKMHNVLMIGNWADALAIKDAHGHESEVAKHVDKLWVHCRGARTQALTAALSFPSRGYADLAAKLAFARGDREISAYQPAAAFVAHLYGDVERLSKATPPESGDKELIDRVSECEAAIAVHRALSAQLDAEH